MSASEMLNDTANFTSNAVTVPSAPNEEPRSSEIFRVIVFSVITFASLFGNIVICKTAYELPARKPLSYQLVTNLAVAEIISTLCLPFVFVYQYRDHWPFGGFLCSFAMALQVTAIFVVTNTLAAIAVYRVVFIVFQPSRRIVTERKIILLLGLMWGVALVVVLPLFMFHKIFRIRPKVYCNTEFPGDDILQGKTKNQDYYNTVKFILNFGLPYLIMVGSYVAVALKLKKHIRRNKEGESFEMQDIAGQTAQLGSCDQENDDTKPRPCMARPAQAETELEIQPGGVVKRKRRRTRDIVELEYDLLRMIYVVIIVFVLCYLPYQVHFLFINLGGYERYPGVLPYQGYLLHYSFLVTCLPSALHPLFYGTMNTFYARSFSRLVLCRK